jgi:ubiquinone/menaquinone biosynthesis C-methylase UbiE
MGPEAGPKRLPPTVPMDDPQVCCDDQWEEAYLRFESPEQEVRKFRKRLVELGAATWDRDARVVELFCGRGNGLHALEQIGFRNVEGVDLSERLLAQYTGKARCVVGDCRRLRFEDGSKDVVIVQGGLHHLPTLPDDLEQTLGEIHRVLRVGGIVVLVEPWTTPFLNFVHAVCQVRMARALSSKIDALATMIEHEITTYKAWLSQPRMIMGLLDRSFEPVTRKMTRGKLCYVGRRRP